MAQRKSCSRCKRSKPVTEFTKNRSRKDGLSTWCKPCTREHRSKIRRQDEPPAPELGPLVTAVELTLRALGDLDAFSAEVVSVRILAATVEQRPNDKDLWREFRLALKALREATKGDSGIDESIKDLLARLGNPRVG